MNKADTYYFNNLNNILNNGSFDQNPRPVYKDGKPAHSKFITGVYESYNLMNNEFPITTLRNTAFKTAIKEILWIYQLQSNKLIDAKQMGINWWDEWNIGDNTIGHRYGYTIKKYDLINKLLHNLKHDPFSRRHIINMLQENDLQSSKGLYPCAYETIWSVRNVNNQFILDCTLIQRSNDYIMAGYINKIQYVALQMMIASHLNYTPGIFNHLVQNLHIYDRHINAANEIIDNYKNSNQIIQPIIKLKEHKSFYDFNVNDFILPTFNPPKLKAELEIAV